MHEDSLLRFLNLYKQLVESIYAAHQQWELVGRPHLSDESEDGRYVARMRGSLRDMYEGFAQMPRKLGLDEATNQMLRQSAMMGLAASQKLDEMSPSHAQTDQLILLVAEMHK